MEKKALLAYSAAAFFICAAFPIHNPDFFWHAAVGKWQWLHHAIPRTELFAVPGESGPLPWPGFEWLSELFYFCLWAVGGAAGTILFKALLGAGTAIVVDAAVAAAGLAFPLRVALPLVLASLTQRRWMAEPEIFSFFFLAVLLWLLETGTRHFGPKRWPWLAGLFAIWANLHGGFLYGLVLLAAYAFFSAEAPVCRIAAFGAAAGATLLNPFGWEVYRVPIFLLRSLAGLQNANAEWMPPALSAGMDLPLFAVVAFAGLGAGWLLVRKGQRPNLGRGLALAMFAGWGVIAHRNLAVCAIVISPLSFIFCGEAGKLLNWTAKGSRLYRLSLAALVVGWMLLIARVPRLGMPWEGVVWDRFPKGLAEAAAGTKGPVMAPFHWSGYLVWRFFPERRVYSYGRLDVFARRMAEAEQARRDPAAWQNFLDRRGIGAVLEPMPGYYFPGRVTERAAPT